MLETRLGQLIPHSSPLSEALRYTLLLPGKRLRPRIVLDIAKNDAAALDPACAIELVHTYSLIHDDLPCMDDDDMRRGHPTLHTIYDEATAVLAGDYLLTLAFEVLANAPHLTPEQRLDLIRTLSMRACGMVDGQHLDLSSHSDIKQMHLLKTGALFQAAFEFGAIIAGIRDLAPYQEAGAHFGLAYQLLDDIQDGERMPSPDLQKILEGYMKPVKNILSPSIDISIPL